MERIVDISSSGMKLSLSRGFLVVKKEEQELGRIALTDVHALIIHAYGASITTNLLAKLAEGGTPVVLCDATQHPVSITLPLAGHFSQNARMREQWEASLPLRKQIWKKVVVFKIEMQASLLAARSQDNTARKLKGLTQQVKSGDPNNIEGQAARFYWPALMGKQFKRMRNAPGINAFLNYGYTIIRSTVARAVVASGLHPSVGVAHTHREDSMALADDLMEPFRPIVDAVVLGIVEQGREEEELDPEKKRSFAKLIALDLPYEDHSSPLYLAAVRLAQSVAKCFNTKDSKELSFFRPLSPIEWSALWVVEE